MNTDKASFSRDLSDQSSAKMTCLGLGQYEYTFAPVPADSPRAAAPSADRSASSPVTDTFVTSAQPDTVQNYGADTFRAADTDSEKAYGYLRFSESTLPVLSTSCLVRSAVLRLTVASAAVLNTWVRVREVQGD